MTVTAENPLGLDGFEFVEFTSPDPAAMKALIEQLGFTAYSKHPTRNVVRYKQGRINLLVSEETQGQAAQFRADHGPSASGMAFRVDNAKTAFETSLARGGKAANAADGVLGEGSYVLEGSPAAATSTSSTASATAARSMTPGSKSPARPKPKRRTASASTCSIT
jgi:4-hydroxyphenylpyruvate dioxygenase